MQITSFSFLIFLLISLVTYYLIPKRFQWCSLLLFSILFFIFSTTPITGLYLVASIISTHFSAKYISYFAENGKITNAKLMLTIGIIVNLGILVALKYSNFGISIFNSLCRIIGINIRIDSVSWLAPLGISFYTLQIVAYLVDTYGGITKPENNIFKTALFVGYFPQLTSGPIAKHEDMKEKLFSVHEFNLDNVLRGVQRVLWGIFKKIVVSVRLGVIVDTIYADTNTYSGIYVWIAAMFFLLQLYMDFSGCMDIVIGVSECYGIILPENFDTPFLARTVQEFWQRWHITLGGWLRDYVMYPLLRTKFFKKLTTKIKNKYGRKLSKEIPTYMAMLVVWCVFGLWHGGKWKFIIGEGLFCYLCILLGKVLEPYINKLISFLKIDNNTFSWHLFQSIWVFILMSIANMFFKIDGFMKTLKAMRDGLKVWNPWILFDGSFYKLGISEKNVRLMIVSVIFVFLIELLGKKCSVRDFINKQNLPFRWIVWTMLLLAILIFGFYGSGYDAASFIYEAF